MSNRKLKLLLPLFALLLGAQACSGDDCARAGDCKSGEVCYRGVCTPGLAPNASCKSDEECGNGFTCFAARCRVSDTVAPTDASVADTGMSTPDAGDAPDSGL
jgi:hypothetical protein